MVWPGTPVKSSKHTSIPVLEENIDFASPGRKWASSACAASTREVIPPGYTWQFENDPDFADRETRVSVAFLDVWGLNRSAADP